MRLAIDNDPFAIKAYRLNHRKTRLWCRDLYEVTSEEILEVLQLQPGELDLLAGCPPCQGFSALRTLNGTRAVEDARNDLVATFGRLVKEIEPKAVLMENVPGLARDSRLRSLVLQLRRHRYSVNWAVLDAADYGIPQRRRRLILFAARSGPIALPEGGPARRTVRQAIGDLPPAGTSGDPLHDHLENRSAHIQALIRRVPKDGGSRTDLGTAAQLPCHQKGDGFYDVYGRMHWGDVSPTITSGFVNPSKGRFLHPEEHRTITLREAALLQSFPLGYKLPMHRGKYPVAELLGNAVPPLFAEAQARCIMRHLDDKDPARA